MQDRKHKLGTDPDTNPPYNVKQAHYTSYLQYLIKVIKAVTEWDKQQIINQIKQFKMICIIDLVVIKQTATNTEIKQNTNGKPPHNA